MQAAQSAELPPDSLRVSDLPRVSGEYTRVAKRIQVQSAHGPRILKSHTNN
jgi:hypothetical protein